MSLTHPLPTSGGTYRWDAKAKKMVLEHAPFEDGKKPAESASKGGSVTPIRQAKPDAGNTED
jgi:hypothetical protein